SRGRSPSPPLARRAPAARSLSRNRPYRKRDRECVPPRAAPTQPRPACATACRCRPTSRDSRSRSAARCGRTSDAPGTSWPQLPEQALDTPLHVRVVPADLHPLARVAFFGQLARGVDRHLAAETHSTARVVQLVNRPIGEKHIALGIDA